MNRDHRRTKGFRPSTQYDVVVVGGGHAGCEAAMAAARMGLETLLLSISIDQIAQMSCNPAIGGLAKGHVVREIDALGGVMAQAIDATGIQFRRLNTRKGPAVRSSRAQADMLQYKTWMKEKLEGQERLHIKQGLAEGFLMDGAQVVGVHTQAGEEFPARTVVVSSGTFLNGMVHIGDTRYAAGRAGEFAAVSLSAALAGLGLRMGRLMTCTTPRLDAKTIDFRPLTPQNGDPDFVPFSFRNHRIERDQVPCWIARTNEKTHRIIADNLDRSPMISGVMTGAPPRYCPSVEDKVRAFPGRTGHRLFLEPEGLSTREIYTNGMFTGLPIDVQLEMLRTIPGLEEVQIMRPGYAIEYDFVHPTQLGPDLQVKSVPGLFLAGQINGTSGYEEAAGQGLVAGINAGLRVKGDPPLVLGRNESYIGVLVDDLVTKGTSEPYRLLTSRAEHRLLLREDNADLRLMDKGHAVGLITAEEAETTKEKARLIEEEIERLGRHRVTVDLGEGAPRQGSLLFDALRQPEVSYRDLTEYNPGFEPAERRDVADQVQIQVKYEGYIRRQEAMVEKMRHLESLRIPEDIDYSSLGAISAEVREKLEGVRPRTLGQASRIPGVTPAAVSALMIYLAGSNRGRDPEGDPAGGGRT
ncbi:MAG: tRNA uridine-5-carboxymethylaminomethyl(34) synthesis enzyme MnmG [bacterium]|nr:MAG: tRNA uridine-5-carboxymethylaminomethyl(34) synthesis enzyme MnmG [bacterium]